MVPKDILASDGFFTLLQNNEPKKIGEIRKGRYYIFSNNKNIECVLISFDFDQNNNEDHFFFHRDRLLLYVLCQDSLINRKWLYDSLMIGEKTFSTSELINTLVESYTASEMGF